jgi:hypothetical protein
MKIILIIILLYIILAIYTGKLCYDINKHKNIHNTLGVIIISILWPMNIVKYIKAHRQLRIYEIAEIAAGIVMQSNNSNIFSKMSNTKSEDIIDI